MFVTAWLIGEAVMIFRISKANRVPGAVIPPGPGQLLTVSGFFIILALISDIPAARQAAILTAWGLDIAAVMGLFDKISSGTFGGWPPATAPNTVIFPDGSATKAATPASTPTGTKTTIPPQTLTA
jgi:hypothetical protein